MCKSCATHPSLITCSIPGATLYEGTAQLLSLTEFKSHLCNFILLAEPLTDGGEEIGVPRENP